MALAQSGCARFWAGIRGLKATQGRGRADPSVVDGTGQGDHVPHKKNSAETVKSTHPVKLKAQTVRGDIGDQAQEVAFCAVSSASAAASSVSRIEA
jgi:hypothetical protein